MSNSKRQTHRARLNLLALGLLTIFLPGSAASERLNRALDIKPLVGELEQAEDRAESPEDPLEPVTKRWTCPTCTEVENRVLGALQDEGITDRVALAVLLGNIRQESRFETTICEGGQKTGYHRCHRGGFGLIQWTTASRYNGLGRVAREYQLDPNSLDAQLKWLFSEVEWKQVVHKFKTVGQSMSYYMDAAYQWLRWGKHGNRTYFSQKYLNNLQQP